VINAFLSRLYRSFAGDTFIYKTTLKASAGLPLYMYASLKTGYSLLLKLTRERRPT